MTGVDALVLEQFKRGGAGFSLAEWMDLSAETQAKAIEIQTGLNKEMAALISFYIMDPMAAIGVLGGPDAAVRAALEGKGR